MNALENRFKQPGYEIYCKLEDLLVKASTSEDFQALLHFICSFYKDFHPDLLKAQLLTFGLDFQAAQKQACGYRAITKPTIFDISEYFKSLSHAQRQLLHQVCRALQMILVMPATNATLEKSFSALRHVK